MVTVAAFYRFFPFTDYVPYRALLKAHMEAAGIKGTVLLAPEGINGTVAGSREAVDALLAYFRTHPGMVELQEKRSHAESMPFKRLKVKLKKEIITFAEKVRPRENPETFCKPHEWNALIADPSVTLIDARNDYEVEYGTFTGAINPKTRSFSELAAFITQHVKPDTGGKIATFCTGGIRCEKLSSWLKDQGFEEVYQLEGGILNYLEVMPPEESAWQGECFVFDEREALGHGLVPRHK